MDIETADGFEMEERYRADGKFSDPFKFSTFSSSFYIIYRSL